MELMRGIAFVALLLSGAASAELRQAELCGDGTYHQAGYCPAVLSGASCSATGATTANCSATSTEADGTRYVCATSSATALTGAEIESCSGGAAIAGSSAAETGSNSVSLSGLTTDAAHYGQIVNKSPDSWYSNRLVSSSFTPTASASGTNASRISAILSGRSPHFSYNTPTDPTTTSTCNAGSASAFNACAAVDGTEITVTQSFSGNISIMADDIDVLMDNAYTITGELNLGSFGTHISRARWTGGNISGALNGRNFDNVLFDDVLIDSGSSPNNLTANSNRIVNLAFINSTIQNDPGGRAGSSWAFFVVQNPNGGVDHQGLILANFKVLSTAMHAWRVQSFDDIVIVDSVFNPDGGALSGMRFHYNSDDIWVKDSWTRGAMHVDQVGSEPGPSMTNARFEDFDRYVPSEAPFSGWAYDTDPGFGGNTGVCINNVLNYASGTSTSNCFDGSSGNSGLSTALWNESTVPDHSAVGAIR